MKKSAFKYYDLDQAKRKTLAIQSFGGVDYSTQKFLIGTGRAIDMKNYVYRDGVIQKRHGVSDILEIKDYYYYAASFDDPSTVDSDNSEIKSNIGCKNFNGMWSFVAEDGETHVIAHIGKLIYEIKNISSDTEATAEPIELGSYSGSLETHALCYEFEDFKSFAYVGGNKLWFQGGNKYMLLRFTKNSSGSVSTTTFVPVENSDFTPIPTTTISITCKNAVSSGRQSLDDVNLLTKWRKNKMISGIKKLEDEKTTTMFYEYTLDAPLYVQSKKDMAEVRLTLEECGEVE